MSFTQSGSAFLSQAGSSVYEPKTYTISTANSYLNPLMNISAIVNSSAVNVPLQSVYWSISNVTSNINSYNFIGNALSGQLNMSGTMDYASNVLSLSANAAQFVTGQQIFKVNILNAPGGTIMASTANIAFLGVPSAVTAVSAVANTVVSGKAAVTFGAPLDDGGNAIIRYDIISIPDSVTVTASSTGTFNVTGLQGDTPYTFVVAATNSIGTGANSAPSNQVTPLSPQGQQIYNVAGTYSFVTPAGLRRVSVVAVGGGGGGGCAGSGGSVSGGDSYFNAPTVVNGGGSAYGNGGTYTGDGGGNGGQAGGGFVYSPGGGGGAGGYSGDGGRGSTITSAYYHPNTGYLYYVGGSTAGAGGGGGGGGSKLGDSYCSQYGGWNYGQYCGVVAGSAGGGVSVFGQGGNGGAGTVDRYPGGGGGGSGGGSGGSYRNPGGAGTCITAGGTAPSYPWGGNPGTYYPYQNPYTVPSNPTGSGTAGPNGYPGPHAIGGGGGGGFGGGGSSGSCAGASGGGGGLGYKNAYPVTPGTPYTVVVGSGGAGGYRGGGDIGARGGSGGAGAVRLIWGSGRAFPTTSTTDAPVIP